MPDNHTYYKRRQPRLLLADDTDVNREIIGAILAQAGYDVDFACNGEDACQASLGVSYDLILMDVEMPGMNGFEAAARIRAREGAMAGVTIAALTSTTKLNAQEFSLWSGIDEFIARPIAAHALLDRIAQILRDRQSNTNDWKPVWRLKVLADFVKRHGDRKTDEYLDHMTDLLTGVASAIDAGQSSGDRFSLAINELFNVAALLGFEELCGICRVYAETRHLPGNRSRDPNILGVVDRTRYAIASYQQEQILKRRSPVWASAQITVQDLFKRRLSIADAA